MTDAGDGWLDGVDDELRSFDDLVTQRAARRFRDVLGHYASGVTVVTAMAGQEAVGLTCQSFSSVSLDPPLVVFIPARTSRTWPRIREAGRFCVNVLGADQQAVSDRFAGRGAGDRFAGVEWRPAPVTGSPLLAGSHAYVDCTVYAVHEAGDHDLVVGRVHAMGHAEAGEPLLFHRGRYRTLG